MTGFTLHPDARLRTPPLADFDRLIAALRDGASIWALQASNVSIRTEKTSQQWLYCQSAGSSGTPKTIKRHPNSWIQSFEANADRFDLTPRDCYAVLGHLGHSLTLFAAMEAFHIGADLVCLTGQRPRRQATQLRDHSVTVLYATPAQLRLLESAQTPLPLLQYIFCGGSKLDPDLRTGLAQLAPHAQVIEFFGASETSFITMSDADTPAGSVGRAYPGVTLSIDEDTGEIWVQSPYLFDSYAEGQSDQTRWHGDWLSIGETGYLDQSGALFLKGRLSRMVTVADQNVYPEEIETLLKSYPGINDCVVVTPKDALRGHTLVCFAVGPDVEAQTAAIRAHCRTQLRPVCVPKRIVAVDKVPVLPSGKPDLVTLTTQAEAML